MTTYQTRIKIESNKQLYRSGQPVKLKKKQGTRLLKAECEKCGYTVRVTKTWLAVGMPACGRRGHGRMACEDFEVEGED